MKPKLDRWQIFCRWLEATGGANIFARTVFFIFAFAMLCVHAFGAATSYTLRELLIEPADTGWVYISDTTGAVVDTFGCDADSAAAGVLYAALTYDDEKTEKGHVWIDYGGDTASYEIMFLSSVIQGSAVNMLHYQLLQSGDTGGHVILFNENALVDTTVCDTDSATAGRLYAVTDYDGSEDNRFLVEIFSSDGTSRSYSLDYFSGSCTTLVIPNGDTNKTLVSFSFKNPDGSAADSAQIYISLESDGDSTLSVGDYLIISQHERAQEIYARADTAGLYSVAVYPNSIFTNDSSWYEINVFTKRGRRILRQQSFRVPDVDTTVWFQNLTRWR